MTDLRAGWAVLGNDGRRVGTVQSVGQNYILTSRHGLSADLYVPVSSIANVENETIHLNITQRDAEQMGWEQAPISEPSTGVLAERLAIAVQCTCHTDVLTSRWTRSVSRWSRPCAAAPGDPTAMLKAMTQVVP